jgi:PAS domain-containing protein
MKPGIGTKVGTAFSVLVVASMVAVAAAVTLAGSSLLLDAAGKRLAHTTGTVVLRLEEIFEDISQDTDFLAKTTAVQRLARRRGAIAADDGRLDWDDELADLFQAFLASRPWYFQVRLIGVRDGGRELVRVERSGAGIVRTPVNALQQKGHRDYVQQALDLERDALLLSPIDLNRERGEISEPKTPTLRGVRPVFDDDHRVLALVVINVAMQPVFEAARALLDPDSALMITNANGDYLFHPDPERTFGFDFGTPHRVQDDIPRVEDLQKGIGTRITLDDADVPAGRASTAHFQRLDLPAQGGDGFLLVGVATPRAVVLAQVDEIRKRSASYTFLFALVAALTALFATRALTRPLQQMARAVSAATRGRHDIGLPISRDDELGEMARGLQAIIGSSMQRNRQIETRLRELDAKERRLRDLILTFDEAVLLVNPQGHIEDTNLRVLDLFGYQRDELAGHHLSNLIPELESVPLDQTWLLDRPVRGRAKSGADLELVISAAAGENAGQHQLLVILRRA